VSVSLSELAEHVGLSPSTVSRALNGYADVSAATRAKIKDAATALNYRPHAIARTLATGKTGVIGLVTRVERNAPIDASLSQLFAGIAQAVHKNQYSVVATAFPDDDQYEEGFYQFATSGFVDAMVLARTRPEDARVTLLQKLGTPFVTYGRTERNDHAWIDVDNEGVFAAAAQRLVSFGHQRFALLNGSHSYNFSRLRESGVRSVLAPTHKLDVRYGETNADVGYHHAQSLLSGAAPPSAFLCATDSLALGVLAALRDANLVAGRDVSVIGYGNSDAARYATPGLTSIEQSTRENGIRVGEFLLEAINKVPTAQLTRLIHTHIVARESDGPAPHRV
jgi:LacI family transcriptional regulator